MLQYCKQVSLNDTRSPVRLSSGKARGHGILAAIIGFDGWKRQGLYEFPMQCSLVILDCIWVVESIVEPSQGSNATDKLSLDPSFNRL